MPLKVEELRGYLSSGEESSDSEQESDVKFIGDFDYIEPRAHRGRLKKIVAEINKKLEAEEPIDLAQYPPLFVVNYRGVHFFRSFFSNRRRRDVRHKIKQGRHREPIYSPAVYEHARLEVGAAIDTPDKKKRVRHAIKRLDQAFAKLSITKAKENAWWGNKRVHDKLIHRHYQRYVNTYAEFRGESEQRAKDCYKILPTTDNPYISTADIPKHAVLYALGGKTELEQGCLRPAYLHGKPKHPHVGYVQILFHKLDSFSRNSPLLLSVLHASNKIDVKDRLLNERETTYKVRVAAKHIVFTKNVRFPAFNVPHKKNYHEIKYGLQSRSYSTFKKNLSSIQTGSTTLLDVIAENYAMQLQGKANQLANAQGGYVVFIGLDGLLREHLPTTADISTVRRDPSYSELDQTCGDFVSQYKTSHVDENSDDEDLGVPLLANSEQSSSSQELQIIDAVKQGDTEVVEALIKRNKKLSNTTDLKHRCSLLMWAIIYHHELLALSLIATVDLSLLSTQNRSALHFAAREGMVNVIEKLVEKFPALLVQQDTKGLTPLDLAVREKKREAKNYLRQAQDTENRQTLKKSI